MHHCKSDSIARNLKHKKRPDNSPLIWGAIFALILAITLMTTMLLSDVAHYPLTSDALVGGIAFPP